ncbi:MAG: hypothetical protein M3P49_11670 [Actinomycetota bacterium]|nr:hypothetical protein [Actinomycetota bacterium]
MDDADREQAGGVDARSGEYAVFCNQPYGEAADGYRVEEGEPHSGADGGYDSFWHEADVLLLAAAREVQSGKLTPAEARKLLELTGRFWA